MKKIGVIFGMETTFPPALVDRINFMGEAEVEAELATVGEVRMAEPSPYHVIVDRISHDIPFYRGYLKNAALSGTTVINNPFWWSADDKFFNYALGHKLGVAIPPTVLLPHKQHPPGTTDQSMRNLQYPMPWDSIFSYVGFPAFLKPFDGGGWKDVYKVNSPEEFFNAYDQSRDLCMTLQRGVNFKEYFRCYVVGQERVHIMHYDPSLALPRALCEEPAAHRSRADRSRGTRLHHFVPRPGLRSEYRGIRLRRWYSLCHRLHESRARRGREFGWAGQLQLDRQRRRRVGRAQGLGAHGQSGARVSLECILKWDIRRAGTGGC